MGFFLERIGIFFLHGFLGLPADWDPVCENISVDKMHEFYPVDYFQENLLGPHVSIERWGEAFNQYVLSKKNSRNILVGYSLGGRLALQALAQNSDLWNHAVFISANAGLPNTAIDERSERLKNDENWALRFQHEDWDQVLSAWNAQSVFAGNTTEPLRSQQNYRPQHLAQALSQWSLAKQPDMRFNLKENVNKLTWVTGESDKKFLSQAGDLQKDIPGFLSVTMPKASHRVLFDQPLALAKIIEDVMRA